MVKLEQKSGKGARLIILFIGVGLLLWNIATISGSEAKANNIQVSRLDAREDTDVGKEYSFSTNNQYEMDGKSYSGLNTGICLKTAFVCIIALSLILYTTIPVKKEKHKVNQKRNNDSQLIVEHVTMAWLMEHIEGYDDDTPEVYYQNSWAQGDPSWQCTCGKWNTESLCKNCGRKKQTNK